MKKGSFLQLLSVLTFTIFFNISSQAELVETPLAEEEAYEACIDDEGNEVACDDLADDVSSDVDDNEADLDANEASDEVNDSETEELQVESACDETDENCTF